MLSVVAEQVDITTRWIRVNSITFNARVERKGMEGKGAKGDKKDEVKIPTFWFKSLIILP